LSGAHNITSRTLSQRFGQHYNTKALGLSQSVRTKAFNDFSVAVTQFEQRLASGEADVWKKHSGELNSKFVAAQKAIRKELGIPRDTKQ